PRSTMVKVVALSSGLLGALLLFVVVPAINSSAAPASPDRVVSAVQSSLVRGAHKVVPAVHNGAAAAAQSAAPAAQSGTVAAAASDSGLKVQDRSHDNDNPDNTLYALYQILNNGTASVPLSSVTMRYWFTNESPADPLVFECDWAQVACSNIT